MVLSETRGGRGATERPGVSEGSGAGPQRPEEKTWESCQGPNQPCYSASEAGEAKRTVADRESPSQMPRGLPGGESEGRKP